MQVSEQTMHIATVRIMKHVSQIMLDVCMINLTFQLKIIVIQWSEMQ